MSIQRSSTYKNFILIIFAVVICQPAFSQNMNNPYSVYGVGDIDHNIYNRTTGMGGTGLALKSNLFLIDNNPASLTGLPRSFYLAQLSLTGQAISYSGDPINKTNSNNRDFWIKRFELAVKVNGFWATSIGFQQYSNVNYKFSGSQFVEGTVSSYKTSFEGDGGLNDYHWQNAVSLGKHFSLGLKSSLIAGSVNQTEILDDEALQSTITTAQQDYMTGFKFQAGTLFETPVTKKWDFSLGARYSPRTTLRLDRTLTVTQNTAAVVEDQFISQGHFYLPETYAAGIALKHNKTTTFAADYSYENWAASAVKGTGWQLINSNRISAGAEFASNRDPFNKSVKQRFFQVGAFYNTSYLQVRNQPVREYGLTGGMGGVLSNSLLYSLSLQAGIKGTTNMNLIKETYIGFTFNISYHDFLFSKGRKYE
jgi:hypothetical protein